MTVPDQADKRCLMKNFGLSVKGLVFAAYVLAMLFPGLPAGGAQTQAAHAQMMALAGHEMTMADMGSSETDPAMLFCKQHCWITVETLPVTEQAIEIAGGAVDVVTRDDPLVSSLAFPPPGHPPKVAVI